MWSKLIESSPFIRAARLPSRQLTPHLPSPFTPSPSVQPRPRLAAASAARQATPHRRSPVTPSPSAPAAAPVPSTARRGDDSVLVDAPVDGRPGHAERSGGPDLVPAVVEQGLHDRVALDRLERGQYPAAHRPALGRQVGRQDLTDPAALHHLLKHLPELRR